MPLSLIQPTGSISTCLLEEEGPNELQKDEAVPVFSGLCFSGLCVGFFFVVPSQLWKIHINIPFSQLVVPLKVETPGFKGQS